MQQKYALAALVVLVLVVVLVVLRATRTPESFASCTSCGGNGRSPPLLTPDRVLRRGDWVGGRGPYNLQLYDSPYFYPYYEARDYMDAWDKDARCSAYCSASEDGGCAVVCR